jgi:predicted nucleotidyltransferase
MVRRLVEVYGPGKIYIFGSVAQGETPADSDYELMVAVPDSSALILQCNQAGSPDPA